MFPLTFTYTRIFHVWSSFQWFCLLKLLIWIHAIQLHLSVIVDVRLQTKKLKRSLNGFLRACCSQVWKKSHSAITSDHICMYISRNRYKNHDPCGRRRLIKLFASIKHIFEKEHFLKKSSSYCLGSTCYPKQKFTGTRGKSSLLLFFQLLLFSRWIACRFFQTIYTLSFLKASESTGNHVYISCVCLHLHKR